MAETCQYQAQIDAQNDAIADLQDERQKVLDNTSYSAAMKARMVATYDAQIQARQDAVAALEAECAS